MRKLCRFVFSRYALSALAIIIDLALLCLIIFYASSYSIYVFITMVVLDVIVIISIINRDANPEYKIPWIVISLVIPFFGAALYLVFYSRRLSRNDARFLNEIHRSAGIAKQNAILLGVEERVDSVPSHSARGKATALLADDGIAGVYRARSEYFPLGEQMLESMLSDISRAEKYVFLEYFIIDEGVMWDKLYAVLREKALHGVDVRVLYDDIGSMKTLPADFPHRLHEDGIHCNRFAKVTPKVSAIHNNRDHRKICVVDGTVAYTGGINIADEYINVTRRFGHWKDGGIRVEGYAALGFTRQFLTMWDFTTGGVSNYSEYFSDVPSLCEHDGGFYIPFGSGPSPVYPRPTCKNAFLNLINQAEHYVYITTPYLIVDHALTEALKCAAMRGVEVIIVTPAIADKKLVKVMTKSSYPTLIGSGVKIYEYLPGFIHEKLLVVDDEYAVVGTINFDYRSLVHHFEDGVWMYATPTIVRIRDSFRETVSVSEEQSSEVARLSFFEWIVKNLVRLFAPLL